MGFAVALFASVLAEKNKLLQNKVYCITFPKGKRVYLSDHFDRAKIKPGMKAVQLLNGTFLAFDLDEEAIGVREYDQSGSIEGQAGHFIYTNEVFSGVGDAFCIYCLILPQYYYPRQFLSIEPHFAATIEDRIRITWWFKERVKIQLAIVRNQDQFAKFVYIDKPNFDAKHPKLKAAYNECKDWVARIVSHKIPSGP